MSGSSLIGGSKKGPKMCFLASYWWAVAMAALTGCARPLVPEDDRDSAELEEDMGRAAWHLCT